VSHRAVLGLLIVALTQPAFAQKSDAADKHVGGWFNNVRATFISRTAALEKSDLDVWEAASVTPLGSVSRGDLFLALPKFNPLWDQANKPAAGAMAKYAKRLEQIPRPAIERWSAITGATSLIAAMSLTAENALFPKETFNDKAFSTFLASFK